MKVKRFSAPTMQQGLKLVREELGADAVILSSRKADGMVEIMATRHFDEDELRSRAPEPVRAKSTAELIKLETERHRQLQSELEKSRQRIAAVRQARSGQQSGPAWPQADTGGAPLVSKVGREAPARRDSVTPARTEMAQAAAGAEQAEVSELAAMRAEINVLKDMLMRQLEGQAMAGPAVPGMQRELEERLECMGLFPELRRKLLERLEPGLSMDDAWRRMITLMTRSMKTLGEGILEKGGIHALVGPTGSGKTTTIGKLAAQYVLRNGPKGIALVTTDRYRIAAHEQLRALGRILGVPVLVADDNQPLDAILDTLRDKTLVLIDTAGLNQQDKAWTQQLNELKSSRHRVKSYLVVSAINQSQVMKSTYHAYKTIGLAGCMITKLDEAVTLGEALSLAVMNDLPIAYVTDGQKIPDDIHLARAGGLMQRALRVLNPEHALEPGQWEREQVV